MAVERAAFALVRKEGPFEVRRYEPHVLAVSRESDLRGGSGFGALFDYISGGNRESRKIAMTAPVLNNLDERPLTTAFVMPRGSRADTLPQPVAAGTTLVEVPERLMAVVSFSGNIRSDVLDRRKAELLDWVRGQGLAVAGPVELARYNPPFLPGFIKTNELLVEVTP